MQLRNHADTTSEAFQSLKRLCDICSIKVRENEIALRKLSGDTAHLRTLEVSLIVSLLIEATADAFSSINRFAHVFVMYWIQPSVTSRYISTEIADSTKTAGFVTSSCCLQYECQHSRATKENIDKLNWRMLDHWHR